LAAILQHLNFTPCYLLSLACKRFDRKGVPQDVKNCFEGSFKEERLGTLNYVIGALNVPHEPLSIIWRAKSP
jgi:hypothetical protein